MGVSFNKGWKGWMRARKRHEIDYIVDQCRGFRQACHRFGLRDFPE